MLVSTADIAFFAYCHFIWRRSQWPRGLRRRSAAPRLLISWFRKPPGAWMFVCCDFCALSGRGLCDGLITRPDESYRLWCVVVCDLESWCMRRPWPTRGCRAKSQHFIWPCFVINFYFLSRFALFGDFTQRIMVICYRCFRPIYCYYVQRSSSPSVDVHGMGSNRIMAMTVAVEVSLWEREERNPLVFRQSLRLTRWAGQSQLGAAVFSHSILFSPTPTHRLVRWQLLQTASADASLEFKHSTVHRDTTKGASFFFPPVLQWQIHRVMNLRSM